VTVTDKLKALLAAKDAKTGAYAADARAILLEVRRQFLEELAAANEDSYSAYRLQQNVGAIERLLADAQTKIWGNLAKGMGEMWNAGTDLLPEAGAVSGLYTGFAYVSPAALGALNTFGEHLVKNLTGDALAKIRGELTLGLLGGKTPAEVTRAIAGTLESPGVFESIAERATVITKTEIGRAYSTATQRSLEAATGTVPELEKQWVHAGHPRHARIWHVKLHGQHVPVDKPFLIGSVAMMFPRDPLAPASEVINCGCDVVPWHPSWPDPFEEKDGKRPPWPEASRRPEKAAPG
jgi:hypothetical protein